MSDDRVRRHVIVQGLVQGVCFRAETRDEARTHGVDGWVRNRRDGSVEAVFEGPAAAVDALVDFCREGPRFARVEAIEVTEEPPEPLTGFHVRH